MKHIKKVIALLLAASLALTGCTQDEQKLISALDKLSEAKYYEQKSHISFELNYSGGDEYFREEMSKMKNLADAFSLDYNAVYEGSIKNSRLKSYIGAGAELEPVTLSGEMWFDMDMEGDNPKNVLIAKIPALAKAFMSEEYIGDYLYIDYVKYMDAIINGQGVDSYGMGSLGSLSSIPQIFRTPIEIQKKKFGLAEIIKASKVLNGNITLSSKPEGGMEKLTLKMSDQQFKKFVIDLLSEMSTNGEILDMFMETFGSSVPEFWNYIVEAEHETGETKLMLVEDFDETILALEEYFKNNAILGSGGLVYEIAIDENGYIVSEATSANIRISEELCDFAPFYLRRYNPFYLDEDSGTLELTINIETENSGFNASKTVKFPMLTKENTFDVLSVWREEAEREKANSVYRFPYASYMFDGLSDIGETPVDLPIAGTYNGIEINSAVSIINLADEYDSDFQMPLRQAAELFGGEVGWNEEKKFAFWKLDDIVVLVTSGDAEDNDEIGEFYYSEGGDVFEGDLNLAYYSRIVNNTAFIELTYLEDLLDIDFGFDDTTNRLLIR